MIQNKTSQVSLARLAWRVGVLGFTYDRSIVSGPCSLLSTDTSAERQAGSILANIQQENKLEVVMDSIKENGASEDTPFSIATSNDGGSTRSHLASDQLGLIVASSQDEAFNFFNLLIRPKT